MPGGVTTGHTAPHFTAQQSGPIGCGLECLGDCTPLAPGIFVWMILVGGVQ